MIRLEFLWTLILDGAVLIVAVVTRYATLWTIRHFSPASNPAEMHTFSIRLLEFICDFSIVAAAAIFTVFDLTKRVIRAYRALRREFRSRRDDGEMSPAPATGGEHAVE